MPLHDWTDDAGWDGFHLLWIAHLFHAIKPQLPDGYRVYVGSAPPRHVAGLTLPDIAMLDWPEDAGPAPSRKPGANGDAPHRQQPAVPVARDPQPALFVMTGDRLIAVVEFVSRRSKEHASVGSYYFARYVGCLKAGAHLLLVDVHRYPRRLSFADALLEEMEIDAPLPPPPLAICFRIGEATASGNKVGLWPRILTIGEPLPMMPLPLVLPAALDVNLEETYMRTAADAYMA